VGAPGFRPLAVALIFLFAASSAAPAATVRTFRIAPTLDIVSSTEYTADPGEQNELTLSEGSDGTVLFTDPGATISVGEGCAQITAHQVACPKGLYVRVTLWDGPDRAVVLGSVTAPGCTPQERFCADVDFYDGAGDDSYRGSVGADRFLAGESADGSDFFSGGSGSDWVLYGPRSARIFVSLDDRANDGAPQEGDNVASDVEHVQVNTAATFIGNASSNEFLGSINDADRAYGGRGDDFLVGVGGNDRLYGGRGADTVFGQNGDDLVVGGRGNDRLSGGRHDDVLRPGRGRDVVDGKPGSDTFYARDGARDRLIDDWPRGRDTAFVDAKDILRGRFEVILRRLTGTGPTV
jgi:Ca2+-binding RTX toxin-like protein